jgi:hypothetical protein
MDVPLRCGLFTVGGTTAGSANRRQVLPARSLRHIAIYMTKRSALRATLTRAVRLPFAPSCDILSPRQVFEPFRAANWFFGEVCDKMNHRRPADRFSPGGPSALSRPLLLRPRPNFSKT